MPIKTRAWAYKPIPTPSPWNRPHPTPSPHVLSHPHARPHPYVYRKESSKHPNTEIENIELEYFVIGCVVRTRIVAKGVYPRGESNLPHFLKWRVEGLVTNLKLYVALGSSDGYAKSGDKWYLRVYLC